MYEHLRRNLKNNYMSETSDSEEGIDTELLHPWEPVEADFPMFQEAVWQNLETAQKLAVEMEAGPYDSGERWQISLLEEGGESDVLIGTVEDGFNEPDEAIHEAKALMAVNEVEQYVDE